MEVCRAGISAGECGLRAGHGFSYSVVAGVPEKMIEYVLETRIDAQTDLSCLDPFLEDFILTHILFMPSNVLCNYLKNYYEHRGDQLENGTAESVAEAEFRLHGRLQAKRRVISFLGVWEYVLGIHFFLDHVANSFVEVGAVRGPVH